MNNYEYITIAIAMLNVWLVVNVLLLNSELSKTIDLLGKTVVILSSLNKSVLKMKLSSSKDKE